MFSQNCRALLLAGALTLAACSSTPPITAPQVIPPPPKLSDVQKSDLRACCTMEVQTTNPDGTVTVTRKVKPGTEIVWEVLAFYADYFNLINMSRAIVDETRSDQDGSFLKAGPAK